MFWPAAAEPAMPSHPDLATQLDPATLATLVRTTLDALPVNPDWSAEDIAARREAALLAIAALGPRDPIEAMLAARAIVTHYAVMECFRRAVQPDIEDVLAMRLRNNAIALSRLFTTTLRELEQMQARPARPVQAVPETAASDADNQPEIQLEAPTPPDQQNPLLPPDIMAGFAEEPPPATAEAWLTQRDAAYEKT
jgi:hypothetical protein